MSKNHILTVAVLAEKSMKKITCQENYQQKKYTHGIPLLPPNLFSIIHLHLIS